MQKEKTEARRAQWLDFGRPAYVAEKGPAGAGLAARSGFRTTDQGKDSPTDSHLSV